MPLKNRFSQVIGLSTLDIYIETPPDDNTYFNIEGLPDILGYGKYGFRLSFKDPVNRPVLKNNSPIIFEAVDSRGEVIFSELSDIPDLSGAATAYLWIKKDPLRIAEEIADGPITLYVVGELDGVPDSYKGRSNLRSSFKFQVRKDYPNLSPILFYDVDGLKASSSFSESLELDDNSNTFFRGYINISASHLQTQGGRVAFGELSFKETGSKTEEFTVLSEYKLSGNTTVFETSVTGSVGTSPISHIYKTPIPKDIRRDTPVIFKLRFLDENKNPAKHYDEHNINQDIEVTSSVILINGSPTIIEKEDNLLKGSMFTGNAVGKGFEQSGKDSAFLKTVDYTGFKSASLGKGSGGVMFFSGSVLPGSGDDYEGVGLELFANTESFFKFRSDPSELDVRAKSFFVGSEKTQFISASGGNIEISSSGFHLHPDGQITASKFLLAGGTITGDVTIQSGLTVDSLRTPALINGIASTAANASSSIDNQGFAAFRSASIGGFVISPTEISSSGLVLKSSGEITGSSTLLGDKGAGQFLQFRGSTLTVQGDITANNIRTPATIDGAPSTAANASSSIDEQGFATFKSASIGGFNVSDSQINSENEKIILKSSGQISASSMLLSSGSFVIDPDNLTRFGGDDFASFVLANDTGVRIQTSNFNLNTQRFIISSSDVGVMAVGSIPPLSHTSGSGFFVDGDGNFLVGKAAGPRIQFDGFKTTISSSDFYLGGGEQFVSGANGNIEISSSNFHLQSNGNVTMAGTIKATAGAIGGFTIDDNEIKSGTNIGLNSTTKTFSVNDETFGNNGIQLQYLDEIGAPRFHVGNGSSNFLKYDGSTLDVRTDAFFVGNQNTQFISGSNNIIEISSSNFHLSSSGDVVVAGNITATSGEIGGFTITNNALSSDNFFISGAASNNELFISSSGFSVDAKGVVSASALSLTGGDVAGLTVSEGVISVGDILKLKSSGQITASNAQITGKITAESGTIGGFNIATDLDSTAGTLKLKGATGQITASNAQITGKMTATSGEIGGFTIGEDLSNSAGGSNALKLKGVTGQITASKAQITGKITAQTGTIGGFNIGADLESSAGTLKLKGATGQITASDAQITGKVTAQTGTIGGFNIGTDLESSAGTLKLKGVSGQITGSDVLFDGGVIGGFELSSTKINSTNDNLILSSSGVISASQVLFTGGRIGGFDLSSTKINSTNNNLILSSSGVISASQVLFTGGKIGGFTLSTNELTAEDFEINPSGKRLILGSGTDIFIADGDEGIQLGNGTFGSAPFSVTKAGVLKAESGTIGGFTLSSDNLTATNFTISPSGKSITLGSGTDIFVVDGDVGIQLGNGTFGSAPFSVTKAGVLKAESGTVGGFTLSSTQITSNNLIMDSTGVLETSDFAAGVKGWRISSEGNGEAEFENVRIRGTLSTAVFEKETVNAVGGQLYVANSTAITGSGQITASNATMSVVNVSGFVADEILSLKKVSDSGFTTEYVLVQSASRDDSTSDTNFAGKLFLQRGYGIGTSGDSGSLGGTPANSQSYEPGQVIVSTGKEGTGYIRLNANPNDDATPFIDIVERTGSGVYDVDLKARLGDLSGLSTARLQGTSPTNAGFGLYSQNVFLEGGIIANTGSIAGIEMQSGKLFIGAGTHGNDNTGFFANSDGDFSLGSTFVWDAGDKSLVVSGSSVTFNTGRFFLGGGGQFISGSSGNIEISSSQFHLDPVNNIMKISGSIIASDGLIGGFDVTSNQIKSSNDALILGSDGSITGSKFLLQGGTITSDVTIEGDLSANSISTPSGGSPLAKITDKGFASFVSASIGGFHIDDLSIRNPDNTLIISSSETGTITMGPTPPLAFNNGNGFFADGGGQFLIGSASGHRIQFDGNDLIMSSSKYFLGDRGSSFISGSNGVVEISSSNFHLARNGDIVISGDVTATTGNIGGFTIDADEIKAGSTLILDSDTNNGEIKLGAATSLIAGDGIYMNGSGHFRAGKAAGQGIKFDGTNVILSSSAFNLGNADNFISGSTGNLKIFSTGDTTLSGSSVTIATPKFFFGSPSQFISGSSGNIEITSSMFHLDPVNNKVAISGSITATDGNIGGFALGTHTISTTGALIGDSSQALFLSSSIFKVDHVGNVTASNVDLSGKITATSGEVGGFTIDSDEIKSTNVLIDSANEKITLGSGNAVTLQGGGTDNFIAMGSKGDFDDEGSGTTGILIGMDATNPQAEFVKDANNYFIFDDGIDIRTKKLIASGSLIELLSPKFFFGDSNNFISGSTGNLKIFSTGDTTLSGSSVNIHTPKFFLGDTTQFVSGSNGNIEISSSMFHLDPVNKKVAISGSVVATDGSIGGWVLDATTIAGGDTTLTNDGTITLGGTANTGVDGTNAGIYMDAIGDFLVFGDANNFIRFDVSDKLTIASENFSLSGSTTLAIDIEKIRLGANATTTLVHGSTGIFLDKGGDFSFVEDAKNFIKGGNSDFEIRSENFSLTGSTTLAIDIEKIRLGASGNHYIGFWFNWYFSK